MKYFPHIPELFTENRARFVQQLPPSSIAIFVSNDEMPSNGDAHYPFKQNSSLFWLSGIAQEDSMVILFPDNPDPRYREVLVLVRPNEMKEKWDGKRLRAEEGRLFSGIKTIIWLDALDALLQQWVHLAAHVYLHSNENDRKSGPVMTREYRYIAEMKEKYPLHDFQRSAPIIKQLRGIKTAHEVGVMQKAMDITDVAFRRLLGFIRPGVMEFEIEAEIQHSFISQRSSGPAYSSIVASGDRARTLHYITNDGECLDGELVLMDFGAEYGGYCADLTRTVPVNGRFTPRQKEVYNACLAIHNFAKRILRPGLSFADYQKRVAEETTRQMIGIGLVSDEEGVGAFMYHGVSHHLGIDVHDMGPRTGLIEEGMVLTVEPGIYIEAEGMGIRIENDVWITADGCKDLMAGIPITVEEIEALMGKR